MRSKIYEKTVKFLEGVKKAKIIQTLAGCSRIKVSHGLGTPKYTFFHSNFMFFLDPHPDRLFRDFILIFNQKSRFWTPFGIQLGPKIDPGAQLHLWTHFGQPLPPFWLTLAPFGSRSYLLVGERPTQRPTEGIRRLI